jgi:ATP-dependent RNA helicase DDX23/PRP28
MAKHKGSRKYCSACSSLVNPNTFSNAIFRTYLHTISKYHYQVYIWFWVAQESKQFIKQFHCYQKMERKSERKRPLAVEELLAKRSVAQGKPVFLTRAQRQQLSSSSATTTTPDTLMAGVEVTGKQEESQELSISKQDLCSIRQRYMGDQLEVKAPKPKRTTGAKSQFRFEWKDEDDTSLPAETILPSAARPMFGRGKRAGMDDTLSLPRSKVSRWDSFNWREKPLEQMNDRDWRIIREDFSITTKGKFIPRPLRSWTEGQFNDRIKRVLNKIGYKDPTPIQRQAIPIGLQNRDIIGVAETGSGKTVAFLIPMLQFILFMPQMNSRRAQDGPYAIVLAPTRELAQQIEKETNKFTQELDMKCLSIVGGHSAEQQALNLQKGVEIVIATPGRLRDMIERRSLVLNQCTYIVMDEADRMIEMGFEDDVNYILDSLPVTSRKPDSDEAMVEEKMFDRNHVPLYRQTTMFSATMPPQVERIAKQYLSRPAMVTIGSAGQAVDTIRQMVEFIPETEKFDRLLLLLSKRQQYPPPIIVFVNMKTQAEVLGQMLEQEKYRVAVLHGGKSQELRESALKSLKRGDRQILVATDIASRGIDIANVSLVVNYDMAKSIEDYTHRIGRTGRAGKTGTSMTFLTKNDSDLFFDLKKMLGKSGNIVPKDLAKHPAAQFKPGQFGDVDDLEAQDADTSEQVPENAVDITQQAWY